MLSLLHWLSLVCALGASACFWLAVLAVKGGPFHRAAGRAFARSVYATAWAGAGLALAGLITRPGSRLAMAGTVLLLAGAAFTGQWVVLVITPIGFVIGLRNMSYAGRSAATAHEWEAEHLTSMVTAGIVLHTALVIWLTRSSGVVMSGVGELVVGMAPALLGLAAIVWMRARRRG